MNQNLSQELIIRRKVLTLAAAEIKKVDLPGNCSVFLLENNSSTDNPYITLGKSGQNPWPVLFDFHTRDPEKYFDCIIFENQSASPMTLTYWYANGVIDNKAAKIFGTVSIVNTSDTITTAPAITVLPFGATEILIDGDEAVDVGGGVVGIPITAHPFFPGNVVVIANCPQYNGTYTVLGTTGVNQVDITAAFQGGNLDAAAAVNVGGGVVGIPITGHPYTAGETITLAGTINYDGDYIVLGSTTVNQVDITAAYVAEVFTGAETHNLTFDNADDSMELQNPNMIPGDGTRKELHIANHDAANDVFFGDNNVDADAHRGIPIQEDSVYILTTTDDVYLGVPAALAAGVIVSWINFTNT